MTDEKPATEELAAQKKMQVREERTRRQRSLFIMVMLMFLVSIVVFVVGIYFFMVPELVHRDIEMSKLSQRIERLERRVFFQARPVAEPAVAPAVTAPAAPEPPAPEPAAPVGTEAKKP